MDRALDVIGKTLGPYRIESELGSGGMGRVYAAVVDERVPGLDEGTRVALKIVHPHLLETEGFFKRFLREAEVGKSVRHPNVVRTYDCDATGEQHFIVMEFVEGQTLGELLLELERVPEELCRHIGHEVARGLAAIYAVGVIHRDVKPDNVLITRDHVVKVMDLGVARLVDEALRLSQTGAFVGSLEYAAPESFRSGGAEVDGRVDLHALGLVLYELSCGVNPYSADDVPKTIRKVLHEEPRRLGDANPQLSPFFEEVVHTLLEKDPAKRFAAASELASVLHEGEDSAWWRERAAAIRAATQRPLRRVRVPRETAVYGREVELATLGGLFERASSGDGQVVLIEGEAGIGKSRLVDELIGRLQRGGQDLNFLFGSYPPGGAATAAGGFSTAFREQFGDAGSEDFLLTTPVLVPAFDALLRGETTPEGSEPLTKGSLQTCFVNATRALAAERPTVVLIDDLHFAPEEGRSLFTALAMAVPGHRVLLIGTTRRGVAEDWLSGVTRLDQASHLTLQRLGPKDLFRLLQDTLKSERLAHDLSGQISVKSDGNPFFVFEILRGLREEQFITRSADGSWVGTKVVEHIQIPSSVLDLVNARVVDLTEEERDLLDVACCWGYEFDPTLIGEVCGLGRIPSLKSFGNIERRHRLARSAGRDYVFDHHQVQEALYQRLNEQLREEYHAALAEGLEARTKAADVDVATLDGALCVDLCEHFLRGARGEQALRYLPAAQRHLGGAHQHAQVVDLTDRALALPGLLAGAERARALLQLAHALDQMGRRARQDEASREAQSLAEALGDDELRMRAARSLARALWRASRLEEAAESARHALEFAEASGDRKAVAAVTGNQGLILYAQGRLIEARDHHERALAICREIGDRQGERDAMANLGNVATDQGHYAEAQEHLEQSLAIAREIGDLQGEATTTGNLGGLFWSQGRLKEALDYHARHLALSREVGQRRGEATATGNRGVALQSLGHLAEAREHYERYVALCREIGDAQGQAIALHNLSNVHREEAEPALALESLSDCLTLSEEIGFRHLIAVTRVAIGAILAAAGDQSGARASLDAARELAAEMGIVGTETLARCHLACLSGGDVEDAVAAFTENRERLEGGELREVRWLLWKATGDEGHLAAAKRLLDDAVANVDPDTRTSMLTNLRLHRDIAAASKAHGL